MARRTKVIKKAAPKKLSPKMKEIQRDAMYGSEPKFSGKDKDWRKYLIDYYNWINASYDHPEFKDMVLQYTKTNKLDTKKLQSIPSSFFIPAGKIAYLLNGNRHVDDALKNKFDGYMNALNEYQEPKASTFVDDEKMTAREKLIFQYQDLYTEIDQRIKKIENNDEVLNIIGEAPQTVVKMISEHYQENLTDYQSYLDTLPKRGKSQNKDVIKSYIDGTSIVCEALKSKLTTLENIKQANKIARKPRAKKAVPASKIIMGLKFRQADTSLGLQSINPEAIIGAKAILIYNTKTRKFGKFQTSSSNGLSVKGTTIINYDQAISTNKTLRKPKEQISQLTGSTLKRYEVLYDEIKAVSTPLKGRINEDILILKAFK